MRTMRTMIALVLVSSLAHAQVMDLTPPDAGTDAEILTPLFVKCPPLDPTGAIEDVDGTWHLSKQQAGRVACMEVALQTRTLQLERTPPEWKFNWSWAAVFTMVTVFLVGGLVSGWELRQAWQTVTGK